MLHIQALRVRPAWFGAEEEAGRVRLSPFVSRSASLASSGSAYLVIAPPEEYRPQAPLELQVSICGTLPPSLQVEAGGRTWTYRTGPRYTAFSLPPGILGSTPYPIRVELPPGTEDYRIVAAGAPKRIFPLEAVPADPGAILLYDQNIWRDRRYELFRWEQFPSILIFDTADYEVQDRLFKRLAFFVEKAGFRGRLAADEEIAGLHGWNAHDYQGPDLASFFNAARNSSFPLLHEEERELEAILLAAGILVSGEQGQYSSGPGAIISISQESAPLQRSLLFVHEGFHGLFFIDPEFRSFCEGRYNRLDPAARRFLLSFFGYQQYDTADPFLMVNEFMAHLLQQPVEEVSRYFGQTLPSRLAGSWRVASLPPQDRETGRWPDLDRACTAEARALSTWVAERWGLSAGSIRRLHPHQRPP
jgi:hypothetical protein